MCTPIQLCSELQGQIRPCIVSHQGKLAEVGLYSVLSLDLTLDPDSQRSGDSPGL